MRGGSIHGDMVLEVNCPGKPYTPFFRFGGFLYTTVAIQFSHSGRAKQSAANVAPATS